MADALARALLEVLQWDALSFMLIGVAVGFWVGLLPGLGGGTTLALMLPFVYKMQPVQAFAFLLGLRYTFGSLYLWNGLSIVPVLVGFFAIPEIIDLAVRGTAVAGDATVSRVTGVAEGVRDSVRHFWLTIRCSIIGTYIGIVPGLGGGVAQWIAYAHAVQSARTPAERQGFGKGDVREVLGPGAANNSKEGGALIPTIAFGVPGSSSMAILLGAFFLVGLTPWPEMLTRHLDVTLSMT